MAILNMVYYSTGWGGWREPWVNTIAYYPLNSTSTVNDMSGNGYNLTNHNVSFWNYGNVNCGFFNNGSIFDGNYVSKSWALITWNSTFTVSIWCNASSFDRYGTRYIYFIWSNNWRLSASVSGNSSWHKMDVCIWTDNKGTNYAINTGNWYNIIFTYLSVWGWTVYVNWNSIYTWTWSSPTIASWDTIIWRNPDGNGAFNGYLSEFILEGKVWSADEALAYYNQTKANYWL